MLFCYMLYVWMPGVNLSPSRYVNFAETEVYRDVPEILDELKGLQAKSRVLDQKMGKTLSAVFKSNRK